jgi:7,8-dihydropterin-6-yl-methyl-4-(beta-D-ribofuranosyl)aminobenzene 5'-phosphate synthase
MEDVKRYEIKPVDEVRVYDLLGDFAGVQGSRIEDAMGNVLLRACGNYDLTDPERSFSGAHAFANFIRVTVDGKSRYLMLDVGQNKTALKQNIENFRSLDSDFDPRKVEMILLSHGHSDHFYNLNHALEIVNPEAERTIPLYVSGESFFRPRAKISKEAFLKTGEYLCIAPDREGAVKRGGNWIVSEGPVLLMDGALLYLGGVRPEAKKLGIAKDYEMKPRPWPKFFPCDGEGKILEAAPEDEADEDTSIVFNIRDKGLVVITACSHGGVNTTLLYAKTLTGMEKVYCYYGGFHPNTDVEATVKDLLSQNVRYLIPTHCTPWPMVNLLWKENQKAERPFLLTKNHLAPVGNVYTFSKEYEDG